MDAKYMPCVGVVVVSYNVRGFLLKCLQSLAKDIAPFRHEVVVVDNASCDGSAASVRAAFPNAMVVDTGRNVGFAAANNVGIRRLAGDYILLLNPDTLVLLAPCRRWCALSNWTPLQP